MSATAAKVVVKRKAKGKKSKTATKPGRLSVPANKGIYTDVKRVRDQLDKFGLNEVPKAAIAALEDAEPHLSDPSKKDSAMTPLVPTRDLPIPIQQTISRAMREMTDAEAAKKTVEKKTEGPDAVKKAAEKKAREEKKFAEEKEKKAADRAAENAKRVALGLAPKEAKVIARGEKKETPYHREKEACQRLQVRIGKGAAPELAALLDLPTKALLEAGFEQAIADKNTILRVSHLLKSSDKNPDVRIFKRDVWNKAAQDKARIEEEEKALKAERTRLKKEGKEVEKKTRAKKVKDEDSHPFKVYVKRIAHHIINTKCATDPAYEKLKISDDVLVLLDRIIIDTIKTLVNIISTDGDHKTVTKATIRKLIKHFMFIACADTTDIDKRLDDKVAQREVYLAGRKQAKLEKEVAAMEAKKKEEAEKKARHDEAARLAATPTTPVTPSV